MGRRIYPSQDLGTWGMESSFFLSVVRWPWLQHLLNSDPRPTNSISGSRKRQPVCSANSLRHSHAYSILENCWSRRRSFGLWLIRVPEPLTLRCYHLSHRTSLPLWSEGRPHVSALPLGTVWPGCWAGLLRGVSGLQSGDIFGSFSTWID